MNEIEKLSMQSPNLTAENVKKIGELFPEVLTEALDDNGQLKHAINFDKLKQVLSEDMVEGKESYEFTWVGKREAMMEAGRPTTKTLRPDRESSVNFDTTENIYIEGDNLEALKILQESYLGKIKMIYIDPPYNTGNDFVYNDSFNLSNVEINEDAGIVDELGNRFKKNESSGAKYHSNWLNMMYPRLKLARNLLKEDGLILISIDQNEIDNLKMVGTEVFGKENLLADFIWKKKQGGGNDSNNVVIEHEYIVAFSKSQNVKLMLDKKYKLADSLYPFKDENGEYGLITLDKSSIQFSQSLVFEITDSDGNSYFPRVVKGKQSCWRWSKAKVESEFNDLVFKNGKVYTKYYRPEGIKPKSLLIDPMYGRTETGSDDIKSLFNNKPFSYPKPVLLIEHFLGITTEDDDIILDFFSGSATTAHSIFKLNTEDSANRKFIMIQLPESTGEKSEAFKSGFKTIPEIGKERIRRAGKKIINENPIAANKLDIGFKSFIIDESNMKDIYYKPSEIGQGGLLDFVSNVKDDRSSEDLLYQTMLSLGMELSLKIEKHEIKGTKIFNVDEGSLIACFDLNLTETIIREIASEMPLRAVFKESSFTNSSAKINLKEIFKELSPGTKVKVI